MPVARGVPPSQNGLCYCPSVSHATAWRLSAIDRDLATPFPFARATEPLAAAHQQCRGYGFPGILEFCHQGCANYSYLVVNGAAFGTIWNGRPDDDDFRPTELSFSA